jgi:thiol-disulfide isomerase/thioredoxin
MNSSKLIFTVILIVFTIFGIFFGYSVFYKKNENTNINWLFERSFPDINSQTYKIENFLGDKFTVLNFWATWCVPCIEEMPMLSEFHESQKENGVKVIGLALDTKKSVTNFIKNGNFKQHILIVGTQGTDLIKNLGNERNALPYTLLIDRNGNIKKTKLGRIKKDELLYWVDNE